MTVAHSLRLGKAPTHLQLLLLVLLAFVILGSATANATATPEDHEDEDNDEATSSDEPTPTKAPVYLPHYNADSWSVVRGSIITSNATASETTYTIFCPTETPLACDLSLEFPFVIVEGPHTVRFHGTVTSTYTANVECELEGKTAATCSGYSSYRSDYSHAFHEGPTETSWTSTLVGPDVEWGTLTLTDKPSNTDSPASVTEATEAPETTTVDDNDDMFYTPQPTSAESAMLGQIGLGWAVAASIAGAIMTGFIV